MLLGWHKLDTACVDSIFACAEGLVYEFMTKKKSMKPQPSLVGI